jgi:hypothetical protein
MSDIKFAVSGQHYLFNVQTFASIVLVNGGDAIYFPHKELLPSEKTTDLVLLEKFITEKLGGNVNVPYDKAQGRIVFK